MVATQTIWDNPRPLKVSGVFQRSTFRVMGDLDKYTQNNERPRNLRGPWFLPKVNLCCYVESIDSANQLTREYNQAAGKTWVWIYYVAGNILIRRSLYRWNTGPANSIISKTYSGSAWGSTGYNERTITNAIIDNILYNGTLIYTWKNGPELMIMTYFNRSW